MQELLFYFFLQKKEVCYRSENCLLTQRQKKKNSFFEVQIYTHNSFLLEQLGLKGHESVKGRLKKKQNIKASHCQVKTGKRSFPCVSPRARNLELSPWHREEGTRGNILVRTIKEPRLGPSRALISATIKRGFDRFLFSLSRLNAEG